MMIFSSPRLLLSALLASIFVVSSTWAQKYSCTYTEPLLLDGWGDGDFYMEHYANYAEGTITMRLTYDGGDDSWVAIGINMDGGHHMTNSIAVIGDIQRGVKFYWMTSEEQDASGVWPLDDIHGQLQNTSFKQEDGQSILEFTMNMDIADEDLFRTVYHTISEDSAWIWAAGLPGNQWQGIHTTLGFFSGMVPQEGCVLEETDAPTSAPTDMGTTTSTGTGEESLATGEETFEETPAPETSSSSSTSTSQINFGGSGGINEAAARARGLWVSHGVLMGIAWGVLAPLAVGAAYLKKIKFLQRDAWWLCLHFYLSFSAAILTIFGFLFAVLATKQEGDLPHFKKDVHHKAGLAIFILVLVQITAGFFRPSPNPPKVNQDAKDVNASMNSSDTSEDGVEGKEIAADLQSDDDDNTSEKKHSWIRQYWEYFHRFLGITLLALAWYNCNSGIVWQAAKYEEDDEQTLMAIFWSITGLIAGMIFFVGYVIRAA